MNEPTQPRSHRKRKPAAQPDGVLLNFCGYKPKMLIVKDRAGKTHTIDPFVTSIQIETIDVANPDTLTHAREVLGPWASKLTDTELLATVQQMFKLAAEQTEELKKRGADFFGSVPSTK